MSLSFEDENFKVKSMGGLSRKVWVVLLCFLAYYAVLLSLVVYWNMPSEKPAEYVQTYRGWIIIKVKDYFHPPGIYVAYKNETVILGVDLPDLIADIDEAER